MGYWLWAMGYGLWAMGYWRWAMGYWLLVQPGPKLDYELSSP